MITQSIELMEIRSRPERNGVDRVRLGSNVGEVEGRFHHADGDAAIVWVFGSGGGLGGPAGGLYTRLGERMAELGVASLELDYRRPGDLRNCVIDVLLGVAWLESLGKARLVLVGHSFGGMVVIGAGAVIDEVVGVAALSSQRLGTEPVARLTPRPVLFVHGEADEVLPETNSRQLHEAAREPKQLILYPGCGHGLDACRDELDRDLTAWLRAVLDPGPAPGA